MYTYEGVWIFNSIPGNYIFRFNTKHKYSTIQSRHILIFITVRITTLLILTVRRWLSCGTLSIPIGIIIILVLRCTELVNPLNSNGPDISGNIIIIDFFQYWMVLMCLLILVLSTQASLQDLSSFNYRLLKLLFLVNFYLVIIFIGTQNMFSLFILFEISIIPIFIVILGWGYQPEKIKAAYSLFFFTAVSASPIVTTLTYFFIGGSTMFLPDLGSYFHFTFYGEALNFILLCGFLVKLPIYGLHLWLPLAHVEAPVYGSIILAGILLKLGGLGILRLNSTITSYLTLNTFIVISLLSVALVGATCLYTTDLKKIIAFSSVSHIAFSIIFLIRLSKIRRASCMLIIIAHAFRSSGIFLIVYIFYLTRHSRNILVNTGMLVVYPYTTFIWLMIIISRLGGPPAINMLAEVWCIIYRFMSFYKLFLLVAVGFMFARGYHFVLYSTLSQSNTSWDVNLFRDTTKRVAFSVLALFHIVYTVYLCLLISSFI